MRIIRNRPRNFGWWMLLTRLFASLFLVFSTYNPTGWSLWHWTVAAWSEDWMLILPLIVGYIITYVMTLRVAYRSLRPAGIALTIAFVGSLAWVVVSAGYASLTDAADLGLIVLYMLGGVIAVGLCWSHAYFVLTGQVSTDNITA